MSQNVEPELPRSLAQSAGNAVPLEPEQDPRLGDKTPVFMEWLKMYFPEKYAEKYKGRRTHLNAVGNPNLEKGGDVPENHFGKDPEEQWGSR